MFSVVMLNWQRPQEAGALVAGYLTLAAVAQVIVVDCRGTFPQLPASATQGKLTRCQVAPDPGLVARFAGATLARTERVLFVDDDLSITAAGLAQLEAALAGNVVAVGPLGRCLPTAGHYNTQRVLGVCDVLLTRCLLTTRAICGPAADAVHRMVAAVGGSPYGNGEDIVLSYVARQHGEIRALNVPYRNLAAADDQHSISVRVPDHLAHRGRVAAWCQQHLPPKPSA